MVYFFIYLSIFIVLFSNVHLVIENIGNKTKVRIKVLYFISFNLKDKKIDKEIQKLKQISLKKFIKDIDFMRKKQGILGSFFNKSSISEIDIIYYEPIDSLDLKRVFFMNETFRLVSNFINENFHMVKSESYNVKVKENMDIDFHLKFKINLFNLVFLGIKLIIENHNTKKESRHSYE